MRKFLQVIVFAIGLAIILYLTKNIWEEWFLGAVSILFTLSIIFIGFVIFLENRHPTQTLTWLVVLGGFPLIGFFFYIFFGRNVRKHRLFKKKALIDEQAYAKFETSFHTYEDKIKFMRNHQRLLFKLAHKLGRSPISFRTNTKVLTNGIETFDHIFRELQKAEDHIHLEYYIVRHDVIGQKLKKLLIEKAKNGVEVRFLYDAVGSWKLSKKYRKELLDAGVEMVPFLPVKLPFLSNNINFRNHRKIIVIDGKVGFVGGLNIGDEYLGRNPYFGFWRDTHMMLEGEGVRTLNLIFLQDWYYMTGQKLLTDRYLLPHFQMDDKEGGVQLIAGGPDNKWEVIKSLFFSMIVSAKNSIWIASPYFIPDEDIKYALKIAALSGIDVRLLVPKRPDKRIVFYASRSYFPELLEAGVKVYEYEKGFMHSKIIIVDGELASIGTANMDMRSFHLNFEVNAFLYRTDSIETLVEDYIRDIENSSVIDLEQFKKRPLYIKLFESTSRLLSPLL
ncbi:cardiolipin synthase [Aeribacillus pallidus]|uniref:cardiolipin synthase n=1 Tax=Aeribacillus TaxID=1055323 RepID=UPI0007B467D8|nr:MULTISPECIES: cardiolipin synthase [Aeribacillus]KZM55907.1 cardiolipin synthase [Aeribacillus pallidus]MED0651256.1 cardiolipin synthase [Aeribacillus composti]MED4486573.1 cardiolipin synthase [Aeribacillus pallidus]